MSSYYLRREDFPIGTRVEIIAHHKYLTYRLVGKTGIVRSNYGSEIRVEVDGMRNHYSGSGHFYFKPKELTKVVIEKETNDYVKENENMPNITNYFNAVKIQFLGDTMPCKYIYANFESYLKVGNLCVVMPAHHGMALAKVVEVLDGNDYETPREIVAVVDTSFYNERVKARAKLAEIRSKMQERAKQLQDIALYQMLAKEDAAMMDLLNEYQNLPQF